jgi:Na+/proline symporter
MFMIGRLFASGARLFMGSLAMAMILYGDIQWWQVCAAIGVMTLIGIFYTLIGGIRSIIWTDVIQTFVYVGAAVAALVVLMRMIPVDTQQIMSALSETNDDGTSKLTWLKFDLDPAQPFTLWTAVLGFALLNIGFFGTDQDGTQRMLTCKSSAHASR